MTELLADLPPDPDTQLIDGGLDRLTFTAQGARKQAAHFVRSLGLLPRLRMGGAE